MMQRSKEYDQARAKIKNGSGARDDKEKNQHNRTTGSRLGKKSGC